MPAKPEVPPTRLELLADELESYADGMLSEGHDNLAELLNHACTLINVVAAVEEVSATEELVRRAKYDLAQVLRGLGFMGIHVPFTPEMPDLAGRVTTHYLPGVPRPGEVDDSLGFSWGVDPVKVALLEEESELILALQARRDREERLAAEFDGRLLHPSAWESIFSLVVLDPDGWRGSRELDLNAHLTATEFLERASLSTCRYLHEEPA